MMRLDRKKLETVLRERGNGISHLAKDCGISRQSIYNMFKGKSVLSVAFEKLLANLNVEFDALIVRQDRGEAILSEAPESIRKALLKLQNFAEEKGADLFLIGSRARGKTGIRPDWDIAIYFPEPAVQKGFPMLKQDIIEQAFPHRMDIVVLNSAPAWFLQSVADSAIRLCGDTNFDSIFIKGAA